MTSQADGRFGSLAAGYAELVDVTDVHALLASSRAGDSDVVVGTDVQEIAAVEAALRSHPVAYLARVFTAHEQACVGLPGALGPSVAAGLAGRFAAKEAMVKVLRAGSAVPWRDIEIARRPEGWCTVELSGPAARAAAAARLTSWTLSFSHDGPVAVATVVALRQTRTI